ncbi:hypothetical protein CAPTEDRAFT_47905, partial [Capitella teleta]
MEITGVNIAALGRGFKATFQGAFTEVEPTYKALAVEVPSSTSANDYAWLNNFPGMREWVGSRVLKELSGSDYSLKNKSWESTVAVQETDIADDNLGLYRPMMEALGRESAQHPDTLAWEALDNAHQTLCFDKQNFFDADHPVTVNGKKAFFSNYEKGDGAAWYLMDSKKPLKPLIFQVRQKPRFRAMTDPSSERLFMNGQIVYGVDARYNVGFTFPQLMYRSEQPLTAANFEKAIQ